MKYKYSLILILSAFSLGAFSQEFAFYRNGVKLDNNAEITVTEYTEENDGTASQPDFNEYFESNLELRNETAQTIAAGMTQDVSITPVAGTLSFCFGNCVLTNNKYLLETSVPQGEATGFHLSYFVPKNNFETAKAKYSVYNKFAPNVQTSVTVTYVYANNTAVSSILNTKEFNAYQAGKLMNINYDLTENGSYSVQIFNLVGNELYNKNLSETKGNLKISGLSKGIYLLTLKKGNQTMTTRKVVIR